ncbi:MAG: ABC transporter permease subunit [Candidatus Riflebacteria bacterium]|nr:ABC transporter permease subunit [Candidatus Riflebacteria bacterium]
MQRFLILLRFEIKKVMARKKAILFLLALNVVPILAGFLAMLLFMKFKTIGIGGLQYSILNEAVRGLFTAHLKLFAWISPFFLALVIGDSISSESARGHLKTLLLTPVTRVQVLVAKAVAVLFFLLAAITVGGIFLQISLIVARFIGDSPDIIRDVTDGSTHLVSTMTALELLSISFVANMTMVSFFTLFALFAESAILMTFTGLIILMGLETFVLMAPTLGQFDPIYLRIADWCFTRHPSKLFELETLSGLMDGSLSIAADPVRSALLGSLGWALAFFSLSIFFFRRKSILN